MIGGKISLVVESVTQVQDVTHLNEYIPGVDV